MFKDFTKAVASKSDAMIKKFEKLYVVNLDKEVLYNMYLDSFPEGTNNVYKERREFDCNYCKQFIRSFGHVVAIDKDNNLVSIWDVEVPHPYNVVAQKLSEFVKSHPIKDMFFSEFNTFGVESNVATDMTRWHHFHAKTPTRCSDPNTRKADVRDDKNVFMRSMTELTLDSGETYIELVGQKAIDRGEEFLPAVKEFVKKKKEFLEVPVEKQDAWCWVNSYKSFISRINNQAVGTFLKDLSQGVDLETALTSFQKVMNPNNYKRPVAVFTERMKQEAAKKIEEMGLTPSLGRRYAVLSDIKANNVIFLNRDVSKPTDPLAMLKPVAPKYKLDKLQEISIDDFIKNVVPNTSNIEVLFENRLKKNLVSLVAPKDPDAPPILKWDNNYSWSYVGDLADSETKTLVKQMGGNVAGDVRFSIKWNDSGKDHSDLDAHCVLPDGRYINFLQKNIGCGSLDVDIITPNGKVAVENIVFPVLQKIPDGEYLFKVHCYSKRGIQEGFSAEIEFGGQIHSFTLSREMRNNEYVEVAKLIKKGVELKLVPILDSSTQTQEIWGVNTNDFVKVSVLMLSPNYWDSQGVGNRHYMFMLQGCVSDVPARGFYNEFLRNELNEHRKVFEALGSAMRVEDSDDQLSGLGFSSTQPNDLVVKVEGQVSRLLKIKF